MRRRNGRAALVLAIGTLALTGPAPAALAQDSREALEQQLKAQQARNEVLSKQIAKLEALLSGDVCKDPAAVDAAQKETQALLSGKDAPPPSKP